MSDYHNSDTNINQNPTFDSNVEPESFSQVFNTGNLNPTVVPLNGNSFSGARNNVNNFANQDQDNSLHSFRNDMNQNQVMLLPQHMTWLLMTG